MTTQDEAITALKRGQIDGLGALVSLHQVKALRIAYGILGNRADAEDAVADAFIRAFERIGTYDVARPFEPWFYRIVVNKAIDHRRRRPTVSADTELNPDSGSRPDRATPDELASLELGIVLADQIDALPRPERAVLVLRYYLDLDEVTIAAIVGCPVGTVKSRLHRARARLRVSLGDEGTWSPATLKGV